MLNVCSCNHLKYLSCLAAAGGVSVTLEHGEATGCDVSAKWT